MRSWILIPMIMLAMSLVTCSQSDTSRNSQNDVDTTARKAGRTAHDVVKTTERAAEKAGRKLEEAAHEAREGWKDGEREDAPKTNGLKTAFLFSDDFSE